MGSRGLLSWKWIYVLLGLLFMVSCDSEDSASPSRTLEGTWDLVGYIDHGVSGATTGTGTFRHDSTFVILGTVTYPGEPVDSLDVSGTYQVVAMTVTLTTPEGTGAWSMVFSGDRVVLTLVGADPPTRIRLKRPS
jgi:hypothetical protein